MIIIKFIFPQNYCFKQKLFGFIDYSTLFFNIILGGLIYLILFLFIKSLIFRISIFIILFFPSLIFSIVGFNHEKITYILKYLFIYLKSPKYYLFKKY